MVNGNWANSLKRAKVISDPATNKTRQHISYIFRGVFWLETFSLRAHCPCCSPSIYLFSLPHQGAGDRDKGRKQADDLSMLICFEYMCKPALIQSHQTCLELFSKCNQLLHPQHPPLPNGELKLSLRQKGCRKGDCAILPSTVPSIL